MTEIDRNYRQFSEEAFRKAIAELKDTRIAVCLKFNSRTFKRIQMEQVTRIDKAVMFYNMHFAVDESIDDNIVKIEYSDGSVEDIPLWKNKDV